MAPSPPCKCGALWSEECTCPPAPMASTPSTAKKRKGQKLEDIDVMDAAVRSKRTELEALTEDRDRAILDNAKALAKVGPVEGLLAFVGNIRNPEHKNAYAAAGRRFLIEVGSKLGLDRKDYDVSFNAGGIAVVGDCSLRSESVYIFFALRSREERIYVRRVFHRYYEDVHKKRDGVNCCYGLHLLERDGLDAFVEFVRRVIAEEKESA